MQRAAIKSSLLASVGYDPATKVLEVQFSRGSIYQYSGVEPEQFSEMMNAKSIGSHFLKVIKPNFSCKRMDGRDSDATRKEEDDQTRPEKGWPDPEDAPKEGEG
jgi:hypothetical protein